MNKKGSSAVFLVFILCGVMGAAFAFIVMTQQIVQRSAADSTMSLAGRSVLSEYDRNLKEYYGLFAFRGQQCDINAKMSKYVNATLSAHRWLGTAKISSDTSEYSLSNLDSFEEEILEYAKYAEAEKLISSDESVSGGGEGKELDLSESGRSVGNKGVSENLPSGGISGSGNVFSELRSFRGDAGGIFKSGVKSCLVNRYIMEYFRNAQDQELDHDTFFKYEVEYIIAGNLDDDKNRKEVRRNLKLARNAVNLIYLLTDPEKMAELQTAAETITPGPAAAATHLALAESWALAEAENDVKLLEHGRKVPLEKTSESWACGLENIIKNRPGKYIDMDSKTGLTYQGYLKLLLFFEKKDRKYGRMMDLMQINIQGLWDQTFMVREHNTGFRATGRIGGRKYTYENEY